MKVSVITGACGGIGTKLVAYLADDYMVLELIRKNKKINNERYFHIKKIFIYSPKIKNIENQ